MTQGHPNALTRRLCIGDLIYGVAHDEHVIDTDANKEEGHQLVNTCTSHSDHVHETEAGSVRKQNADDTCKGHPDATVNCAKRSKHEEGVDADQKDGRGDQREIIVDVLNDGLEKSKHGKQMRSVDHFVTNLSKFSLISHMELVLEAKVRFILDLRVARLLNCPEVVYSSGTFHIVGAKRTLGFDFVGGVSLDLVEIIGIFDATEQNFHIDIVLIRGVDFRVTLCLLDCLKEVSIRRKLINFLTV